MLYKRWLDREYYFAHIVTLETILLKRCINDEINGAKNGNYSNTKRKKIFFIA